MGFTFYLAIINNIFSIAGLAGVLNAQVRVQQPTRQAALNHA